MRPAHLDATSVVPIRSRATITVSRAKNLESRSGIKILDCAGHSVERQKAKGKNQKAKVQCGYIKGLLSSSPARRIPDITRLIFAFCLLPFAFPPQVGRLRYILGLPVDFNAMFW